jgi:hypothetical protein
MRISVCLGVVLGLLCVLGPLWAATTALPGDVDGSQGTIGRGNC